MNEPTLMETDPVKARMILEVIIDELGELLESDRFGRYCGLST